MSGAACPTALPTDGGPTICQAALDGLQASLCVLDASGHILLVNRAWCEFAQRNGAQPERTGVGTDYLSVCESDTYGPEAQIAAMVAAALRDVLAGRRSSFELEYPCHLPNEELWFLMTLSAVGGDGPARAVVVHQPVTARKAAQRRLMEMHKLEALGTLAGGVAHDFNNLLAAILGQAHLALEQLGVGHPVRGALQQIERAGQRGRDIVRQILAFTRNQPHEPQAQPLAPLVQEALAILTATMPAQVRLRACVDARPLAARVDAAEVQQVLVNLGTNAWQAMNGQAGTVTVGLDDAPPAPAAADEDALPADGPVAHLWVHDDGCGMGADTLAHAFDPFFTTKPMGQGSGMGLSVVRGIVAGLGGLLRVDTVPGQGSTFHVYLPQSTAAEPTVAEPIAPAVTDPAPAPLRRPMRVLLVDDDDVVGMMSEALMQRAGHRVRRLTEPHLALEEASREPLAYDLLVSDHRMPGMTGLELTRRLRAIRPALPVIIMSGHIDDELQRAAAGLSGVRLLHKENAVEELVAAVATTAVAA